MKKILPLLFILLFSINAQAASRIIYPIFKAWDSNNELLTGGLLFTYEPGTSTKKTCYSDAAGTTPLSNPIELSSLGEKEIFCDGSVKLVLAPSTDSDPPTSPIWTKDNVEGINRPSVAISLDDTYSCDFETAVTTIEATTTNTTLDIDCAAIISASGSVTTSYTNLRLDAGASLTLADAADLTVGGGFESEPGAGIIDGTSGGSTESIAINGSFQWPSGQQVFGSNITASGFAKVHFLEPDLWQINTTPGTTDMATAVQAADTAAASSNGIVKFLAKQYLIGTRIAKSEKTHWIGVPGRRTVGIATTLVNGNANGCVKITGTATRMRGSISGISFENTIGTYANAVAITYDAVLESILDDVVTNDFDYSVYGDDTSGNGGAIHMRNCYFANNASDAVYFEDYDDLVFIGGQYAGDVYGIHLDNCSGYRMTETRPESSGTANVFLDNGSSLGSIIGGLNDSGSGDGIWIRDSARITINGVVFYTNGDTDNHISIEATDGNTVHSINIIGNEFYEGGNALTGVKFEQNTTGTIRQINIDGNQFHEVTTALSQPDEVSKELRIGENNAGINFISSIGDTNDNIVIGEFNESVQLTANLTADRTWTLKGSGWWIGNHMCVYRYGAGAFDLIIKDDAGSTLATIDETNDKWACFTQTGATTWILTDSGTISATP